MPDQDHVIQQASRDAAVALSSINHHITDCVEHRRVIAEKLTDLDSKADTIEQRLIHKMDENALEGARGRKQIILTLLGGFLGITGALLANWLPFLLHR